MTAQTSDPTLVGSQSRIEPFVKWAEMNGYVIDYAVNSDLEFHPEILKHYRLVLSVGHDEYWSSPMRDSPEKYIADGGNVAFLRPAPNLESYFVCGRNDNGTFRASVDVA